MIVRMDVEVDDAPALSAEVAIVTFPFYVKNGTAMGERATKGKVLHWDFIAEEEVGQ